MWNDYWVNVLKCLFCCLKALSYFIVYPYSKVKSSATKSDVSNCWARAVAYFADFLFILIPKFKSTLLIATNWPNVAAHVTFPSMPITTTTLSPSVYVRAAAAVS